jgi:hypothetical protein
MDGVRCIWEVLAGVVPEIPMEELTKRFVLTRAEASSEDAPHVWSERRIAAYNYAMSLTDPNVVNWVRIDWVWF